MTDLNGVRWGPASKGPARQLVVLCHGVGADGHDLIDLAPTWARALPDAVFVAPDAPEPYDGAPVGRQWFSLADRTPAVLDAGARRAAPMLLAYVDAELALAGLGAGDVALMGFSQGAMMVLHAGLRRPVPPRGILAYSGALLDTPALAAECVGHTPVLLVHGEEDAVVPFDRAVAAEAALRRIGMPLQTVWCTGLGHGIDDAGLSAGGLFLQRVFA
ncbi:MAG: prolyl oligopeptidase family serine peptidase [Gemmatimonadaceae bacterium]|nr:prolyl oligopeptidase family serine peptidase [Acetobacteraceae bacterium]